MKVTIELRKPTEEMPGESQEVIVVEREDGYICTATHTNGKFDLGLDLGIVLSAEEVLYWFVWPPEFLSQKTDEVSNSTEGTEESEEGISPQEDLLPTIQSRLTQRAKDLSLSIIKPDTFARKLREELISIAGPEAAITYHISAQFDSSTQQLNFQIARLSPKTAIKLQSSLNVTTLQLAYTSVTQSGWRVSIGLNAAYTGPGDNESRNRFKLPKEAETKIEFGVTLVR